MEQDIQDLLKAMRKAVQSWQSSAPDSAFRESGGGYYWIDDDHYGEIFVSQYIVDKYKLGDDVIDPIEEWFEDEEDAAEEWEEKLSGFSHYIITTGCIGFTSTRDDTESPNPQTPRGKIDSDEFKSWWNNFPIELLSEASNDIFIMH